MQEPNRNMTRAYRLLMAVLCPTLWVGKPFSRMQDRGRERRTLSWAVMIRPAFGHRLEKTSPAHSNLICVSMVYGGRGGCCRPLFHTEARVPRGQG